MFRRVLVVVDQFDAGRGAVAFAADMTDQFDGALWVLELVEQAPLRKGQTALVAAPDGDRAWLTPLGSGLTVHGVTRSGRDHQLAQGIAEEAQRFGADLIVLGVGRHRVMPHRLAGSTQERVARATGLPVMLAPTPIAVPSRRPVRTARRHVVPVG
jgi:nucleotide-binding universal stress UspA family protein